jgi:hypothetical protein
LASEMAPRIAFGVHVFREMEWRSIARFTTARVSSSS